MTETRFQIIERFGDGDTQDLCMEIRRLRDALGEIHLASTWNERDLVDWMRSRALEALTTDTWALHEDNGGFR